MFNSLASHSQSSHIVGSVVSPSTILIQLIVSHSNIIMELVTIIRTENTVTMIKCRCDISHGHGYRISFYNRELLVQGDSREGQSHHPLNNKILQVQTTFTGDTRHPPEQQLVQNIISL